MSFGAAMSSLLTVDSSPVVSRSSVSASRSTNVTVECSDVPAPAGISLTLPDRAEWLERLPFRDILWRDGTPRVLFPNVETRRRSSLDAGSSSTGMPVAHPGLVPGRKVRASRGDCYAHPRESVLR